MNTLIKPIIQKNLTSAGYLERLGNELCAEGEYTHPLHSSLQAADTGQAPEEKKSSLIRRRPLPPAKPPMRW